MNNKSMKMMKGLTSNLIFCSVYIQYKPSEYKFHNSWLIDIGVIAISCIFLSRALNKYGESRN